MQLHIEALSAERIKDFYAVNCDANGLDWCNCMAWWSNNWEEFGARTAEQNRKLRGALFEKGEFDGYVLYKDDTPIGWSQVGLRNRLPNLVRMYGMEQRPDVIAITCIALTPQNRGKGLSENFLRLILNDLRRFSPCVVQAFPKRGSDDPWTGPESIFLKCQFAVIKDDPAYPVLEKALDPK